MIDLFYWTTPNGHKITIFLEEAGLAYQIKPIHIGKGEQFHPGFLCISPNNRIPAIIDHQPTFDSKPISVFESGAILMYLADKIGQFLPSEHRLKILAMEWLFWQAAGLGPMAGQSHHFNIYAPEQVPYAVKRYMNEVSRLYAVLNRHLAEREFIADQYSIADMACFPWIKPHEQQGQSLADFPHLQRWFHTLADRPAIKRAYEVADRINTRPLVQDMDRNILFNN